MPLKEGALLSPTDADRDGKLLRAFSRVGRRPEGDDDAALAAALAASMETAEEEELRRASEGRDNDAIAAMAGIRRESMDPEVMRAIMMSLEDSERDAKAPALARHLSQVNPEAAEKARMQRRRSLHQSEEGIFYYGGELGNSSLILSSFEGQAPGLRELVVAQLTSAYIQERAEAEGVINHVPGCTPQLVLETDGDGHCLSHATSLGVWGVHDSDGALRDAMYQTMSQEPAQSQIRKRYEAQLARQGIDEAQWGEEWERELRSFKAEGNMSDKYMGDVHCFVLAQVLRRPIVLYGTSIAMVSGLAGVYLPLLWGTKSGACSRAPACILFYESHFSMLAVVEGEGPTQPPMVPLSTSQGPLPVRFLLPEEEDEEGALLFQYLDVQVTGDTGGGLGALLDSKALPNSITNLMQLSFRRAMKEEVDKRNSGGAAGGR